MDKSTISHAGVARRSGRYPWGSGQRPFQDSERAKRRQEKKAEKQAEKEKQKELKNQFRKLKKNIDNLTDEEMAQWAKRLELRTKILNNLPKEKNAMDSVDKALKKTSSIGQSVASLGDSFSRIKKFFESMFED